LVCAECDDSLLFAGASSLLYTISLHPFPPTSLSLYIFLFYIIHNLYIGEFYHIFGITKGIVIYSVVLIFVNILLLLLNNCI
jgi:hypothetical protein